MSTVMEAGGCAVCWGKTDKPIEGRGVSWWGEMRSESHVWVKFGEPGPLG